MSTMMLRILRWGGLFALGLLVVAGGIGWWVAGTPGLVSAFVGTALAVVFMGLTAASMLIADAATRGKPSIVVFFGTILGVFAIKIVVFVILAIWLRTQTWLSPGVFGVTAIVAVLETLIIDFVVAARSRVPYADVPLPTIDPNDPDGRPGPPIGPDDPSEATPKS